MFDEVIIIIYEQLLKLAQVTEINVLRPGTKYLEFRGIDTRSWELTE